MGWKDAPVVEEENKPAWMSAPVVDESEQPAPKLGQDGYLAGINNAMDDRALEGAKKNLVPEKYPLQHAVQNLNTLAAIPIAGAKKAVDPTGKLGNAFGGALGDISENVLQTARDFGLNGATKENVASGISKINKKFPMIGEVGELVGNTLGLGTASLVGGKAIGKTIGGGAKIADKTAGKISEHLTGVPEKALRKVGTKEGAKEVAEASGKQYEFGKKLVNMVDNFDDYIPEKEIVNSALDNMPAIVPDNIIQKIDSVKPKIAVGAGAKSAIGKIEEIKANIQTVADANGGAIPAKDFITIRRQLDADLDGAFGQDYHDDLERVVLAARTQMKEDLISTAQQSGNAEYVDAMKSWSDKLGKVDRLKKILGKNADTRAKRGQSFTDNLFNKNKTEQQNIVKDVQEIFGYDFLKDAENAKIAGQLGDDGKASWLPQHTTGKSILGIATANTLGTPLLGVPLSSPKIASKFTLPVTKGLSDVLNYKLPIKKATP